MVISIEVQNFYLILFALKLLLTIFYHFLVFAGFHIVVCGLDSIIARRWINGMLVSLLEYTSDGKADPSSMIPLVDGGTEGFKGNARIVLPGRSACIECTLDLYPPQV